MAKGEKQKKFAVEDEHGSGGGLRRFIVTALVIVFVVLIAFFFVARTPGFQKALHQELENRTGLTLEIGKTRVGFPYNVVIDGLHTVQDEGATHGVTVDEVRIGVGLNLRLWVRLVEPEIVLERDAEGNWLPGNPLLAKLGEAREPSDIAAFSSVFREKLDVEVLRGNIRWQAADGTEQASFEGADFNVEPVKLPNGRKLYHCSLAVHKAYTEDMGHAQGITGEWLVSGDNVLLELAPPQTGRDDEPPAEAEEP